MHTGGTYTADTSWEGGINLPVELMIKKRHENNEGTNTALTLFSDGRDVGNEIFRHCIIFLQTQAQLQNFEVGLQRS